MLFVMAAAAITASAALSCPGTTTLEVNVCLANELAAADAELNHYYRAAARRLRDEKQPKAATGLVRSEREWLAYRDAECAGVFEYWRGGTIRTSMEIGCRTRVTKLRTLTIWRNWLTYMDDTSPVLPRPDMGSDAAGD
jgi:uncharacterized protein YecT (DUF1311 family)